MRIAFSVLLIAVLVVLALLSGGAVWAQGYSAEGDRIVVDSRDHWNNWSFPADVIEVSQGGVVRPRFIRKDVNAVLDAGQFVHDGEIRGGIRAAGSDPKDAAKVMDGDMTTFWEPDISDPLRQWWVEIDLGRLVSATKVVLRFVEEGQGDPFLQFRVLISSGLPAFTGSKRLGYKLVGRTKKPNKDQRVFEYELSPEVRADGGWSGDVLQYVMVVVTDSDFDRAEEVTEDEYNALDHGERGAIEYFRSLLKGETQVPWDVYEALDPDDRGAIRYYRREKPRLAEVEVWSLGDNISLRVVGRGGSLQFRSASSAASVFDGALLTSWLAPTIPPLERGALIVDLGATFWVDTIHLLHAGIAYAISLSAYMLRVSDGSRAPDGTLIWKTVGFRDKNPDRIRVFEHRFEKHKARYFMFQNMYVARFVTEVSEIELYGRGYVPEVTLTSDLIELGEARNLSSIEWDAVTPPGTKVEIRTRTGDELKEVKHFFNASGKEITEMAWNNTPGFARGTVTSEWIPGAGWSTWSQYYERPGDRITSPSPRKYALIQVRLLSDDPDLAPALRSITLNLSPTVARRVAGEVSPSKGVTAGTPQEFAFFIRPTFLPTSPGFDEILIEAPLGMPMELVEVSLGDLIDFRRLTTVDFRADEEEVFRSGSGEKLEVLRDRSDSLWVWLPDVVKLGGPDLIRIVFQSTIFLNGALFEAFVANSSVPGVWQKVDPGDVTYLTSSRGTTVSVAMEDRIIGDVTVHPNPFTPNGDGINDDLRICFNVFKINTDKAVNVGIYDLGGVLIRELSERRLNASGGYELIWDGNDKSGRIVPPGIYLCRVSVDVDSGAAEDTSISRLISVVY